MRSVSARQSSEAAYEQSQGGRRFKASRQEPAVRAHQHEGCRGAGGWATVISVDTKKKGNYKNGRLRLSAKGRAIRSA